MIINQPFIKDEHGIVRFKANPIVVRLLHLTRLHNICDLNDLALMDFSQEDQAQFAQLIGYSLCGYHELPYVSDEEALAATKLAREQFPNAAGCRDEGCPIHTKGVKNVSETKGQ